MKNKYEWKDFNKKKPRVGSRIEVAKHDGRPLQERMKVYWKQKNNL